MAHSVGGEVLFVAVIVLCLPSVLFHVAGFVLRGLKMHLAHAFTALGWVFLAMACMGRLTEDVALALLATAGVINLFVDLALIWTLRHPEPK